MTMKLSVCFEKSHPSNSHSKFNCVILDFFLKKNITDYQKIIKMLLRVVNDSNVIYILSKPESIF